MTLKETPQNTPTDAIYTALRSRHAAFSLAELTNTPDFADTHNDFGGVLQTLVDEGKAIVLPNGHYLSDVAATRLRETARRLAAAYHKQNPLRRALPIEDLRLPLQKAAVFQDLDSVLDWLVSQSVLVVEGSLGVRLPEHQVRMPVPWEKAAEEIRAVYAAAGMQPPLPGNFKANYPRDVSVPGILAVLVETGELIRLDDRLYISAKAIEEAKIVLHRLADSPDGITVGGVRSATGASRRVILPLLEYLDTEGVTRRSGESRVLA